MQRMTRMTSSKPPFRADHVGSLLRPAALKRRAPSSPRARSTRAALKAVEDREIERVIKKQEEVGLQSVTDGEFRRSWWHLDFLWGLDGAEKHVMDDRRCLRRASTTRNEGVKVTGKLGFSGHPMIEHFKFVAAHTKQHAEDHDSGAVGDLWPPGRAADRCRTIYPRHRRDLRRSRPGLQESRARLRRCRLPLSAARRSLHRHAVRREVSRSR